ncbi:hypothetical protein BEL04_22025 [Mucilaginibacter sp. PPCGB 2223]|uniref:hypothetical protein n=1 Tax=Mucilaginibacter sp. PPCGB 2223 TaxID=1886027 RepID=UPI0008253B45|nr:hypothetical protein [Mucilaginibacter sp. PPCGB 2223]OCX50462.1 hypothetical protein BEL04_22025 [Mucilaginibacter sp. PPCGB 2223]
MEILPALFIVIALIALFILYKASGSKAIVLLVPLGWLILQAVVSSAGFYQVTNTAPPRIMLAILPPLILILLLFISRSGKLFVDSFNPAWLTAMHIIRILVEIGILQLYLHHLVPQIMTFEGRNLDILSGITAPITWYFGYYKPKLHKSALLAWNFACMALLFNIVTIAILSAPFKFQHFGFEQPNIAILQFPYIWLPCFIVPVVLFSHLVCVRELLVKK